MLEARSGFRFATETLEMRFCSPVAQADHLQCHCAVRDFIFGAPGPAKRGALLAFRASSISFASKPRPVSSRQAGQTPRGASEEIFAPHFAQSLVPAVMSPVGQYLVP